MRVLDVMALFHGSMLRDFAKEYRWVALVSEHVKTCQSQVDDDAQ